MSFTFCGPSPGQAPAGLKGSAVRGPGLGGAPGAVTAGGGAFFAAAGGAAGTGPAGATAGGAPGAACIAGYFSGCRTRSHSGYAAIFDSTALRNAGSAKRPPKRRANVLR